MSRLIYLLNDNQEPDLRLADALLYFHLGQGLGEDRLSARWHLERFEEDDILWGIDQHGIVPSRNALSRVPFQTDAVASALGGKIVTGTEAIEAEMSRHAQDGNGSILRNMNAPLGRLRYTQPQDRFAQHASAIGYDHNPGAVFIQPNHDLDFIRRFLVVGGEIAGETPYVFARDGVHRTSLGRDEIYTLQAKSFMSPLEVVDEGLRHAQYDKAVGLLADHPLLSGAIDVGIKGYGTDDWSAQIETVEAAPPGGCFTFLADAQAYAAKVVEKLHILEPSLAGGSYYDMSPG